MRIWMIFFLILSLNACSPKPYAVTNKQYRKQAEEYAKLLKSEPRDSLYADSMKMPSFWAGTVNFGMRKPNIVVIHHTAQNSCEQTLKTFTLQRTQVSAHYVICKDGTVHHMLNDYLRAWHAGAGRWGSNSDINSSSIGIEIDNNGFEEFTVAQINTLLGLLGSLKKAYSIPTANFIGHADIAPTRKQDPNVNFPWKMFAEKGYGHWYADTTGQALPVAFDPRMALKIIGYDISNYLAAVQAFRRHFLTVESAGELTEPEKKVLYMAMQKYL